MGQSSFGTWVNSRLAATLNGYPVHRVARIGQINLHSAYMGPLNEKVFLGETSETLALTGSSTWARTRDLRINRITHPGFYGG